MYQQLGCTIFGREKRKLRTIKRTNTRFANFRSRKRTTKQEKRTNQLSTLSALRAACSHRVYISTSVHISTRIWYLECNNIFIHFLSAARGLQCIVYMCIVTTMQHALRPPGSSVCTWFFVKNKEPTTESRFSRSRTRTRKILSEEPPEDFVVRLEQPAPTKIMTITTTNS